MSMLADIRYDLSTETLKSKLTIRERAQILCDITSSLQWESYEKYDSNGSWVETDVEKAVEDLQLVDNEKKY